MVRIDESEVRPAVLKPGFYRNHWLDPWWSTQAWTRTGHHYTGTGHGQHWPGQGPATTTQEQAMVATVPRITRTGHHYTGTGHGRHWPGQGPATTTQKQAMADTGQDNKDMPPLHINGDANSFCGFIWLFHQYLPKNTFLHRTGAPKDAVMLVYSLPIKCR